MSYILDALRRADAERGRGGVPSIHTQQQFTPLEADDDRERAPVRRIGWVAGGLGVALVGAIAWIVLKPAPAPVATALPPARAVTPLPASPGTALAPAETSAATPPGATTPDGTTRNDARSARAEERTARASRAARATATDAEAPPTRAAAVVHEGTPRTERPASAASNADRVYALRDLPEDVRRALPAITVNGSTWSNDSASRMLMIGGQIYHEGDSVAPGVALERIKPHAAVLAFRGYRYEMTF